MERQTTRYLARGADFLNLEASADRRQAGGAESQGLGVVGLEGLVLAAETEEYGVLEVGWKHHVLVTSLTRQLNAKIPRRQGDESERRRSARSRVLGHKVLAGVGVEGRNGVTETASLTDVLPGEGRQRGAERGDGRVDRLDEDRLVVELWKDWLVVTPTRAVQRNHIPQGERDPSRPRQSSRAR